jgi:hypothetical protein
MLSGGVRHLSSSHYGTCMQVQCWPCVAGKHAGQSRAVKLRTAGSLSVQKKFFMRNGVMMSSLMGLHLNIIPVFDVLKSSRGGGGHRDAGMRG